MPDTTIRTGALRLLSCPVCRAAVALRESQDTGVDELECEAEHVFPVVRGVPRLLLEHQIETTEGARSILESFSREWAHYDYDEDRTWGHSVEKRTEDFLRHVDLSANELRDRVTLDAGCGNGALSAAVAELGGEVLAMDISESVEAAHARFAEQLPRLQYVQSDLMNPAFRDGAFDLVYCAGVLHHTPNTRRSFDSVIRAVGPGGRMFTWLYWREPGMRARLSEALRRTISPLPPRVKHGIVIALVPQSLIRNRLRARKGRADRLNAREILVRMLDSYTPRYRWTHTPDELGGWYRAHGFTDIKVTEEGPDGFGIVGTRPA